MIEHGFTHIIRGILEREFGDSAAAVFSNSELLKYLNIKTKSASRGSKARGSFGNLYAVYVLAEDYINSGLQKSGKYEDYEGAKFSVLKKRQQELPFGSKLQNHALNHRMNEEFKKYFRTCEYIPILRNAETNRYWINENLLKIDVGGSEVNIARYVVEIIDAYIEAKKGAFEKFLSSCEQIQTLHTGDPDVVVKFIADLMQPNVDARIFEIVSFAILKEHYSGQAVYWGWAPDDIHEEYLILYKTGRTNANDGGIDFVMRPLGRFFQVTETTDVRKYFLDIDKVQRYPVTFVVKASESVESLKRSIEAQALRVYGVVKIVERYMGCVEEVINIPVLHERFEEVVDAGGLQGVIKEIVLQSKVEFNYEETMVEDEETGENN